MWMSQDWLDMGIDTCLTQAVWFRIEFTIEKNWPYVTLSCSYWWKHICISSCEAFSAHMTAGWYTVCFKNQTSLPSFIQTERGLIVLWHENKYYCLEIFIQLFVSWKAILSLRASKFRLGKRLWESQTYSIQMDIDSSARLSLFICNTGFDKLASRQFWPLCSIYRQ